jgi:AcrR family transcriptional regulator
MTEQHEGLRSRKKRMTRDLIAEAALQLAMEKGLDNVTSEEIANIAFVSPRTVSNYFSCKEEAVVAASRTLTELVERYEQSKSHDAPLPALRALVTEFFATRTPEQLVQVRERLQLTESHPMLRKFQMASYGEAERVLRALIAERTATEVGIDVYPSLAASTAVAALRTAFWIWADSDAPDERLMELLAGAFDHIENGMRVGGTNGVDHERADPRQREGHAPSGMEHHHGGTPTSAERQAAAAVVAEAVTIAREALADSAAHAAGTTGTAVAIAAEITADAAATARMDRASAAADAAASVAGNAARAAAATQLRADELATKVSEAAARAVAIITADTTPGSDREAALRALQVAATAEALAVTTAEDTAAAAAGVATAVHAAASDVAFSVSTLDQAIEDEVARVAAALQTAATTIARQVATETHNRATDVALIARGAASAVGSTDVKKNNTNPQGSATEAANVVPAMSSAHGSADSMAIDQRSSEESVSRAASHGPESRR